jgi:hypothetical protein
MEIIVPSCYVILGLNILFNVLFLKSSIHFLLLIRDKKFDKYEKLATK